MVGRAVSPGLSGVGDGRGHVSVVGVLTVDVFMVGGLMVGVGGGRRRSGTAVSTGNCVIDGELLKTSVL